MLTPNKDELNPSQFPSLPQTTHRHDGAPPRVVVFGGQDTPSNARLLGAWLAFCAARLPWHCLTVAEWPSLPSAPETHRRVHGATEHVEVPLGMRLRAWRRTRSLPRFIERLLAALGAAFVGWLDRTMLLTEDGRPRDWRARIIARYTDYTLTALYGRGDLGQRLLAQAKEALRSGPCVVVGHSLGGTLAYLAAWSLWAEGERSKPFALITLGTSSGRMIADSPLLRGLPRNSKGQLALPENVLSWHHFWSRNDFMVAASSLPDERFEGVRLIEVDTGAFSLRNRAHALPGYLSDETVQECIRNALMRASAVTAPDQPAAGPSVELVKVSSPMRSGANSEK